MFINIFDWDRVLGYNANEIKGNRATWKKNFHEFNKDKYMSCVMYKIEYWKV